MLAPFIAALLAPILVRYCSAKAVWILALVPAALFGHFASMLDEIASGGRITGGVQWIPSLGVNFSWLIDGLSLTFALLITGIGFLVLIFTGAYLKNHPRLGQFYGFLLLFMGAMLGLVLADSLLMLFVFWELTSIASFLLIGFDHKREAARRAALQALLVTGLGGLLLLAGLIVIWNITGVREMSLLLATGETLRQSPFYILALVLVLCGAFTKSAQFPFHFWLPNAMEAPTPVSAYLHSATMVKAGVYLLMRLNPVMGGTELWALILPFFGCITLVAGILLSIRQTDLKLVLAYSTVSSLGLLVLLVGIGTDKAIAAAALYLIAHSFFKGALFMVAGIIEHETGTRDLTKLGGLRKTMPLSFVAGLTAALSMAGMVPLYGFIAKEEIYYALTELWPSYSIVMLMVILASALTFAVALSCGLRPFVGPKIDTPLPAHDGIRALIFAPMVLALGGAMAGFFWRPVHYFLASPTASAIAGQSITIKTGVLPDLNLAFALTLLTFALGTIAYLKIDMLRLGIVRILDIIRWGPDKGFDQFVTMTISASTAITKITQSGHFERYMTTIFVLLGATFVLPMIFGGELPEWPAMPDAKLLDWAIVLIAVTGIIAVVWAKDRITAIISLGIQGFAVAVIYMLYGAPDLSFTQFMVETLSVVILALVMTKLNLTANDRRPIRAKALDLLIALTCGLGVTLLLLKVLESPMDFALPEYFAKYSYALAHGQNIVNVILVDFRGVDTLGEIGVVMVAGLAIMALIRVRASRNDTVIDRKETA